MILSVKERLVAAAHPRAFLFIFIVSAVFCGSQAHAMTCLAPPRPFVPSDPAQAREFADIIQKDFETYIADIQRYFLCLDEERARAFAEAQEVSQEYGRFLESVSKDR